MEKRKILFSLLGLATILCGSCQPGPSLTEYPLHISLPREIYEIAGIPVILVGKISAYSEVGRPRPSRWLPAYTVQLVRVTVQVETVLQSHAIHGRTIKDGDAPQGEVPIYYFYSPEAVSSVRWMGMQGRGGHWQLGDRLMFFLQRENGSLRIVCDQWNSCVPAVYTGAHPGYRPHSMDVTTSIIDILLTRGQGATDQQMLLAIDKFRLYEINTEYAIQTLQKLAREEAPEVRKVAAREALLRLNSNCEKAPQWTKGPWADPCFDYAKQPQLRPEEVEPLLSEQDAALRGARDWLTKSRQSPPQRVPDQSTPRR